MLPVDNSHTNTNHSTQENRNYNSIHFPSEAAFHVWLSMSEFVILFVKKGWVQAACVLLITDFFLFLFLNDVKKATLYLWLDRYPPVDRYTVIMWLSGVAAGQSLSREPVFPCIRESLLVYLSPPQRPHCTSRHQQDKTRCHIYGAVSSALMPERMTTGCRDFAAERYDSPSLYVTPEPTAR